jgi:signal transduction histidine kinase
LFGYKDPETVGIISFFELVAHISQKKVQQAFQDIRIGKVKSKQFGYTALDKFSREIEVEVWLRKSEYNGKSAIEGIILDISERKEFHLKEKTYELRMMNEHKLASIGRLATGIAHNLNTPISVIMTNAELLQLKYIDSPELDKILRQAERMSSIINRLLTKSKQEQLQEPQALDLNKLISDELEFLNSNLEFKHNIQKEYFFDEHLPVIYAVYSDFSQSIMNIIQNAIDAMYKRPMKKLTVTTEYKNENITIAVKDTGVGIDEKNYLKLFDPFYTTKPSPHERKDDAPTGTGLGLATVHNLLTPYGVEIDVDSIVDEGTTFTLRVPVDKVKNGNITR